MAGNLNSAFYSAVAGLQVQSEAVSVAGSNIANLTTPGYKRRVATIEGGPGNIPEIFLRTDTSQGALQMTGYPSDLAIDGNGFFQVTLPGGKVGYTRAGVFTVNSAGTLVDMNGNPAIGQINLQPGGSSPIVSADGTVTQIVNGTPQTVGQLDVVLFPNAGGLTAIGDNLYVESQASGQPIAGNAGAGGRGMIVQGALETSNVDLAQETVNLVVARNAYAASAKVIRTVDEMTKDLLKIT